MGIFNKNEKPGRKKPTTGFSELNRRTYEASSSRRQNASSNENSFGYQARTPRENQRNVRSSMPRVNNPAMAKESVGNYARQGAQSRYAQARVNQYKKKRRRIILIVVCALLVILVTAALAFAFIINRNMNEGMDNIGLTPTSLNKAFYMVLMGVDASEDRKADGSTDADFRSDSIMLARIDPVDKKITLLSLHRDIEVDMGKYGTQKLNAAHSLGGPSLVIETVSKLAGVNVNHYAEINFEGFEAAVNDVGGVEVNVPVEINDEEAGGHVSAGTHNLNGQEALIVCRSRHTYDKMGDGDKYRAAAQRMIMSALAKKCLSMDVLTIGKTVMDLSKYIKTDLKLDDMVGLAQIMKDINPDTDVYSGMTPTEGVYNDGVWYEKLDEDEWKKMMERTDKGLPPTEKSEIDPYTGLPMSNSGDRSSDGKVSGTCSVRNGTNKDGLASNVANKLESLGLKTDAGNANTSDYKNTLIVINNESQRSAAEQIKDALGVGQIVINNNEYLFNTDYLVVVGSDYSG